MHFIPGLRTNRVQAQLHTGYRATDGFCMELYYMIRGVGVLLMKSRGQDYIERIIVSTKLASKVIVFQSLRDIHRR